MTVTVGDRVRHEQKNGASFGTGTVLSINTWSKPQTAKVRWDTHRVIRETAKNPPDQSDVFVHTLTVIS